MAERKFEASKTVGEGENEEKRVGVVFKDIGDDLPSMIEALGEELVYNLATSQYDSKIKSAIRKELGAGTPPDQVPERLKNWRPDVQHKVAKNPEEEATQAFLQMTPEQQAEHLDRLRAKLADKG